MVLRVSKVFLSSFAFRIQRSLSFSPSLFLTHTHTHTTVCISILFLPSLFYLNHILTIYCSSFYIERYLAFAFTITLITIYTCCTLFSC